MLYFHRSVNFSKRQCEVILKSAPWLFPKRIWILFISISSFCFLQSWYKFKLTLPCPIKSNNMVPVVIYPDVLPSMITSEEVFFLCSTSLQDILSEGAVEACDVNFVASERRSTNIFGVIICWFLTILIILLGTQLNNSWRTTHRRQFTVRLFSFHL